MLPTKPVTQHWKCLCLNTYIIHEPINRRFLGGMYTNTRYIDMLIDNCQQVEYVLCYRQKLIHLRTPYIIL